MAHAHFLASRFRHDVVLQNTVMNMYAKCGDVEMARKVFGEMTERDMVSYTMLITGYSQTSEFKEALSLYIEMVKMGLPPNEFTFGSALKSAGGIQSDAMGIHYVAIVDLLGRANHLERAERFIKEMPIQPTAAVWKALLGACRMHKNMELGAYAAERVFEPDPHDSGPHMLLSNIYVSAGRLNDAARVRKMMTESGIKKEPACSWVETGNYVHLFVANDENHPQIKEIRVMWEKVRDEIKKIGYVPDTSHVLWYVDQQEREERLQYHSEKLALAFALLNTPNGTPISIKKNIRVCGDCHSAFKFVSKLINREIILRDTNRFHHFRHGSCSCRDYW